MIVFNAVLVREKGQRLLLCCIRHVYTRAAEDTPRAQSREVLTEVVHEAVEEALLFPFVALPALASVGAAEAPGAHHQLRWWRGGGRARLTS